MSAMEIVQVLTHLLLAVLSDLMGMEECGGVRIIDNCQNDSPAAQPPGTLRLTFMFSSVNLWKELNRSSGVTLRPVDGSSWKYEHECGLTRFQALQLPQL